LLLKCETHGTRDPMTDFSLQTEEQGVLAYGIRGVGAPYDVRRSDVTLCDVIRYHNDECCIRK